MPLAWIINNFHDSMYGLVRPWFRLLPSKQTVNVKSHYTAKNNTKKNEVTLDAFTFA